MHAFARETRLSETSFVQAPGREGADYRHRIFMMSGEIPFAGHPSLGTAVAVAAARGERAAAYVQQTRPGLQPVEVERSGRVARVSMLQEPAAFGPELDPVEPLGAAGLTAADADPALPVQVVSTGVAQVIAPVRPDAVARAVPDYDRIGRLLAAHDAIVLYVVAVDPAAGTAHARGFTATAEMGEDPATGSAAGPLALHLARHGRIEFGTEIEILQGVEIGRRSVLYACAERDERVEVGGAAVVVARGEFRL
jgi:trans-2,3-dihydro-3-hydroxyanthranilate isomerase